MSSSSATARRAEFPRITAHDAGAKVLLIEKMPHPGGISILSGGGVAFAHNAEGAFQYLKRTCNGTTPDDILRKMAEEMVGMIDWVTELAKVSGTEPTKTETRGHGTYPFPGTNDIDSIKLKDFHRVLGISLGQRTARRCAAFQSRLRQCQRAQDRSDAVDTRKGIDHRRRMAKSSGWLPNMTANRFASKPRKASFSPAADMKTTMPMKLQYFEAQPVYPVYLGNTGDGLKMAQKAGAGLWHMWHFHGGYGFKFPELPFAIRHVWAGPRNENRKMIWIAVDKFGKRFMDEYPPAPHRIPEHAALEFYDADIQDYPRIPCYLIFDEEGRKLGPIGIPIVNDERYDAELERG